MQRIVLGISVLLILGQNGFAKTNAEYDKQIENEPDKVWKQIYRCVKASNVRNANSSDVNICLKAITLIKKYPKYDKSNSLRITIANTALIYDISGDKLNGYKYYMKAAKLGNVHAQKNLNIMCKQSPWACK